MSDGDSGPNDGGLGDGGADGGSVQCDPKGIVMPACVWRWQTPLPQGAQILGLYAFADDDVFALTAAGLLLHRDGTGWSVASARPQGALGGIAVRALAGGVSSGPTVPHLYIVGRYTSGTGNGNPAIFHSTDKGGSWTEEALPILTGQPFYTDIATNGNDVIAVATSDNQILEKLNGTWSVDATFDVHYANLNGVTKSIIKDVAVGNYGGHSWIISKSAGAPPWTVATITGAPTPILQGVCSATSNNTDWRYWAVGTSGEVLSSTDAVIWAAQTSNTASDLAGCFASDSMNVWAYGRNGTVIHSSNGGTNWSGQSPGLGTVYLSAGTHGPSSRLVVGGEAGQLAVSDDGGGTYSDDRTGPSNSWQALYGVPTKTVYAAGPTGGIAKTVDGLSWQAITTTGTSDALIAVWGSSPTDVYAVGANGTVVHTADGVSFTRYPNPGSGGIATTATLTDVSGLSADDVFIAASTGLFHSVDHSANWMPVSTPMIGAPLAVYSIEGSDLWIGGSSGQIFHSTDGSTWTPQPLPGPLANMVDVNRIRARTPSDLFAMESAGLIAHSSNGGTSWTVLSQMFISGLYDLSVTPTGNYLFASTVSGMAVSTDEGATWNPLDSKISTGLFGAFSFADNDVFVIGDNGIVHFGN